MAVLILKAQLNLTLPINKLYQINLIYLNWMPEASVLAMEDSKESGPNPAFDTAAR